MSTKHLLAEELHPIIEAMPNTDITTENLALFRQVGAENTVLGDPDKAGVIREEVVVPGAGHDVRCCSTAPPLSTLGSGGGGALADRTEYEISHTPACAPPDDLGTAPRHAGTPTGECLRLSARSASSLPRLGSSSSLGAYRDAHREIRR